MIEEVATVSAVYEGGVEVVCFSKSACGQCQQNSQCGTGIVSKALPGRDHRFVVSTDLPLTVNQQVRIGIPERSLIGSAIVVYLFPLLLLLGGALLASVGLGMGDGGTLLGAGVGGVIGFLLASGYAKGKHGLQTEPIIISPVLNVVNLD
ncbi:SoxR reducing system RseC family protein [Oceanisphaera pacifica]|uniref:SoxR reducing system RseC family protein n=1 Tax=Oceanisphaera pacifica TaxID=2818389 RepID=A0ABS3NHS0_9GAMM|nr:SoxR reducing system RseC family protein [Oceanisphaera pacifica]MBO1520138.1 SoxR reducing system RseC family protein [Oceanisphaera pacifica]